jgi:hypothetical protein
VETGREWGKVYLKINMEATERTWKMSLLPEIAICFRSVLNFGGLAPQLAHYFWQLALASTYIPKTYVRKVEHT